MPADARTGGDETALAEPAAAAAAAAVDPPPLARTTAARSDLDRVALAAMASTLRRAVPALDGRAGGVRRPLSADEVADRLGAAPRHR